MQKTEIKIVKLEFQEFIPKTLTAKLKITFTKNNVQSALIKEIILHDAIMLSGSIISLVKANVKPIIIQNDTDDINELLDRINITSIVNEEATEEKILSFFSKACNEALKLKSLKEANSYMHTVDRIETMKMVL